MSHFGARYWQTVRSGFLLLTLILSTFLALPAQALVTVDASTLEQRIDLLPHVQYRRTSVELGLADVRALEEAHWELNDTGKMSFGQLNDALWLRVRLQGVSPKREPTYVRVDYPHHDYIDAYFVRDGEVVALFQGGDKRPFDVRAVEHRTYLFPLDAVFSDTAAPVDLYLRVQSGGPVQVPLDLVTYRQVAEEERRFMLWVGAYFGVIAIMLLYNGFILFTIRNRVYLFYLAYVAATGMLQFALFGLGFQWLWSAAGINNYAMLLVTGSVPLFALAFVSSFIELKRIGDPVDRFVVRALGMVFVGILMGAFFLSYSLVLQTAHVASFGAVFVGFYLGAKYWMRGIKAARIFTIAWFSYLVCIFAYLLDIASVVEPNAFSRQALAIGSVLELALLSLAFADKLNEEKELRMHAQKQVLAVQIEMNEDLDRKVRERTEELQLANQRLQEVSITDGLTKLYNRRHFDELYTREYVRAFREQSSLCVLMIDVDFFKQVNDQYGHQFGDLCLVRAGEIIATGIRRPPDIAARYGGEEFVLVLPNTDLDGGHKVAMNLHRRFAETVVSDGERTVSMTVSIGVAGHMPAAREGRDELLKEADSLLYVAKQAGRNRIERQAS